MKTFKIVGLLGLLLLSACSQTRTEIQTLEVNSSLTTNCPRMFILGEPPASCIQVRRDSSQAWRGFSDPIEGFNYEAGFLYRLELRVTFDTSGMMDVPPRFALSRILSKQAP